MRALAGVVQCWFLKMVFLYLKAEREQLTKEKQLREEAQHEKEELQKRLHELQQQFHQSQEALVCLLTRQSFSGPVTN